MSKFPWKTLVAGAAIVAATAYAYGQFAPGGGPMSGNMAQMHAQMMQSQGAIHGGMHGGMHGQFGATGGPTMPGQDAFGTIQEIVQILEADPSTDWSKVNIAALREHLIDMSEVTLHAVAAEHMTDNGIEIAVTGEGRTLEAIKRMVPAHVQELQSLGWNAKTADLPNGVTLTFAAADATQLVRLKALGFMGIMVQGGHHQPHHLAMARGEFGMH